MKKNLHPKYNDITIQCACGAKFDSGSTLPEIKVDICASCHPFFTGEMRFVDRKGRVEKYQEKQKLATSKKKKKKSKKQQDIQPLSLKEMLTQTKA